MINGDYTVTGLYTGSSTGFLVLYECDSREKALKWCGDVLGCVVKFSLWHAMNDIQDKYRMDSGDMMFPYKSDIPLSLINEVLGKYGLKINHTEIVP